MQQLTSIIKESSLNEGQFVTSDREIDDNALRSFLMDKLSEIVQYYIGETHDVGVESIDGISDDELMTDFANYLYSEVTGRYIN